jgi:hypothetical protein
MKGRNLDLVEGDRICYIGLRHPGKVEILRGDDDPPFMPPIPHAQLENVKVENSPSGRDLSSNGGHDVPRHCGLDWRLPDPQLVQEGRERVHHPRVRPDCLSLVEPPLLLPVRPPGWQDSAACLKLRTQGPEPRLGPRGVGAGKRRREAVDPCEGSDHVCQHRSGRFSPFR